MAIFLFLTQPLGRDCSWPFRSWVSHKHLSGGESTSSPLGGAPDAGDAGDSRRLVRGAFRLMSTYQHLKQPCTLLDPYPSSLLKRRGIRPVKLKHKHELTGYWGVLWKENYVVWIALERWLNTCPCMPLTCEV